MEQEPVRRLYRSRDERMIAGVAGGIAEYFNLDPTLVRLGLLLGLLLVAGPFGPLVYIILILVIPLRPEAEE